MLAVKKWSASPLIVDMQKTVINCLPNINVPLTSCIVTNNIIALSNVIQLPLFKLNRKATGLGGF